MIRISNIQHITRLQAIALTLTTLLMPAATFAAVKNLYDLIAFAGSVLNAMIGLFITFGVLIFIYGLIQYLFKVGEEKHKGLQTMLWGSVAIPLSRRAFWVK